jgi:hypothetical protein
MPNPKLVHALESHRPPNCYREWTGSDLPNRPICAILSASAFFQESELTLTGA